MPSLAEQYAYNVAKGPYFEDESALPETPIDRPSVRFIAYYLPQFHTIPENDRAWGPGFTEWTNTSKALPRYVGHYQPRLPGDLGFYDLSSVETLRRQALLARRGGIYGFCIHHYWFSGTRVLDTPLRNLLAHRDIPIKFCLNWANETWTRKWDGKEGEIILHQRYDPGDDRRYAEEIVEIMRDPRYIRVNGRPLLMIYSPTKIPNPKRLVEVWRDYFVKEGVGDPLLVMPQGFGETDPRKFGLDAAAGFPPHQVSLTLPNEKKNLRALDHAFGGHVMSYDRLIESAVANKPTEFRYFPGVCPNWDNEARRTQRGYGFFGSTPSKYGRWLAAASRQAMLTDTEDQRIVFINAWNEWAEGTYLEPDRHFGHAYLAETRRVLDRLDRHRDAEPPKLAGLDEHHATFAPIASSRNYVMNLPGLLAGKIRRRQR